MHTVDEATSMDWAGAQFEWRALQHNEMAQMVHTEQEKWIDPHQQVQESPRIVLMQRMDQNQQTQQPLQIDPKNDTQENSRDGGETGTEPKQPSSLHLQQPLQMVSEKQQTTLKPAEPQQQSDLQLLE